MTKELSGQEKQHIIDLYYAGYTQPEIHKITNRAVGAISKIINNHYSGLSHNEKEEIIASQRALRKAGITPDDVIDGARTYSQLKKYNQDSDELINLVALVDSKAKKQGVPPKVVLDESHKAMEIADSLDTPIEELPKHCQSLIEDSKRLQSKHKENIKLEQESKQSLNETLQKNGILLQNLEDWVKLRGILQKKGYDANIEQILFMIQNAESENYNVRQILDRISEELSFDDTINEKQSEIKSLDRTISAKQKEIESYKKTITEYEPLLDTIRQFKTIRVDMVVLIQILSDYLVKCQSSKLSKKDAIQYLQEHVSEIAEIANLKEMTSKLKHDIDLLESNISEQTQEKTNLDGKIRALKKWKTSLESQCNMLEKKFLAFQKRSEESTESFKADMKKTSEEKLDTFNSFAQDKFDEFDSHSKQKLEDSNHFWVDNLSKYVEKSDQLNNMRSVKILYDIQNGTAEPLEAKSLMIQLIQNMSKFAKAKSLFLPYHLDLAIKELLDMTVPDKQ